jgi:hypothetical protein
LLQSTSSGLTNLPLGRKIPRLVPSQSGKKIAAPLAKPAVGAALAASFRRFPAASLHQRLASASKR